MGTIKEIARRANVSIGTVDRVIHKRGRVSPKTKEKILKIIEELNYKPNVFARTLKLGKTFRFGVLMPQLTQDSGYWELPARGIDKAQKELSSHKVEVTFFYYDKYSEIVFREVEEKIADGTLDGLLIAPVRSEIFETFVRRLPEGFPFVFYDTFIPDTGCIGYIGQDSFQSGVLAGRLMHLLMKEQGEVAVVKFMPTDHVIDFRAQGFQHFLSTNSDIKVQFVDIDERRGDEHFREVSARMVTENPDLGGIFVTYAATYKFANYIRNQFPERQFRVIGYDPVEENITGLKNGLIDFLITQMPERQGYEGIYTLFKYTVLKEKVSEKTLMPMHIVTKENVDYVFTYRT